jgi:DNA-binding NarL/FixJ family response regulator
MLDAAALVGRHREREVIAGALGRLRDGLAQVIAVTGDPGVGKTRLLGELAQLAGERGFVVLTGQASGYRTRVRLGPLTDALHEHLDRLDPLSLANHAGPGEPNRLYHAVRTLLEGLAPPGLVLLLDDMHRADDDSVDLIARLLRHPPRAPILLVLAYRPRQVAVRLRQAVSGMARSCRFEWLRLPPLSEAEVEALLGTRGTPSWRRALYQLSGGNPFYLNGLAGHSHEALPGAGELPATVRAALLAELEELSPTAYAVGQAAAVVGEPFGIELAADVSGLPGVRVAAAIDEMVHHDLVRPVEGGGGFTFRHALVRQAAYESAKPAWRLAAHERAAVALERRGAPIIAVARHIEPAARAGDLGAVSLLAEAARVARPVAPATAAQWLRCALRLLPEDDSEVPYRAELRISLAGALAVAGQLRESRDSFHEYGGVLQNEESKQHAAGVTLCALVERLLCRRAEARALLLREITKPSPSLQDSEDWPAMALELASCELVDGEVESCRRWAAKALGGARRHEARALEASALGLTTAAESFGGAIPAASTHAEEAAGLVDGLIDSELLRRPDAAVWLGWAELLLERPHDALRHLDRASVAARSCGNDLVLPHALVGRAFVLRTMGRLAGAADAAEEAVDLALRIGSDEQLVMALAARCWVATWAGQHDLAMRCGAAATEWRARPASQWVRTLAQRMFAEARLVAGDPRVGRDLVESAGGPDLTRTDRWSHVDVYELLTRIELAAGRGEAAAEWAARAGLAAVALGLPGRLGVARLATAEVLSASDPAAALQLAVAARDAFDATGLTLEAVRARTLVGVASAGCGEVESAVAELRAAQVAFEASGARGWARHAAAERRKLAGRSARAGRSAQRVGIERLTRRERQVASLVSEGLTNRRIAQRLYVTEKTVEMHLSNIFAKLGASSRVEVARAVIGAGGN